MNQNTNKIYAVMTLCGESICKGLFRTHAAALNFTATNRDIYEIIELEDNGNGADGIRYFGEFYSNDGDPLLSLTSAHPTRAACRAEMREYPRPSWSHHYTLSVFSCDLK